MQRFATLIFISLFIAAVAILPSSCGGLTGEGEFQGFQAPSGATVEMPEDLTIKTTTAVNVYYTVTVKDKDSNPLNSIQLRFICTQCTLYDTEEADGGPIASSDTLAAVSSPYIVKTNDSGQYEVVVQVVAPSALGVSSYDATVSAGIGVSTSIGTITVETLE